MAQIFVDSEGYLLTARGSRGGSQIVLCDTLKAAFRGRDRIQIKLINGTFVPFG